MADKYRDDEEPLEDEAEMVEFDELTPAVEPEPEPAPEPEIVEPEPEVPTTGEPDGAITSEDGTELIAPDGMVFAIYTGFADSANLDDIKLEPGVPTLVSKEQSVTLLTHPFESFVTTDRVLIEGLADEE